MSVHKQEYMEMLEQMDLQWLVESYEEEYVVYWNKTMKIKDIPTVEVSNIVNILSLWWHE